MNAWTLAMGCLALLATSCANSAAKPNEGPAPEPAPRQTVLTVTKVTKDPSLKDARNEKIVGPVVIAVTTDKPIYQPGQNIRFRVDARHDAGRKPVPKGALAATLRDPAANASISSTEKRVSASAAAHSSCRRRAPAAATPSRSAATARGQPARSSSRPTPPTNSKSHSTSPAKATSPATRSKAQVAFHRATGEPLRKALIRAQLLFGDRGVKTTTKKTDASGRATIAIKLPATLSDRPMLAVAADDGTVVEAIVRPVPIATGDPVVAVFPEGGAAVAGLPGRVFVRIRDQFGDPFDAKGIVRDASSKKRIGHFETLREGLGFFELTPRKGRRYEVVVDDKVTPLPIQKHGCVLRSLDVPGSSGPEIHARVHCTKARRLAVIATTETTSVRGELRIAKNEPLDVTIPKTSELRGLVKLTLRSTIGDELGHAQILRGLDDPMKVEIRPSSARVAPGGELSLAIQTRDSAGRITPASFSLAVVDDAVLAMADDRTPGFLAQLALPTVDLKRLTDPNELLAPTPKSRAALGVLVALDDWQAVLSAMPTRLNRNGPGIVGRVVSKTRQPLAGATIVVASPTLLGTLATITDETGWYSIANLDPGTYHVSVYYGDVQVSRRNIRVTDRRPARVFVRIDTTRGSETILIEGRMPTIDADSTKTGVTITRDYTRNIPVPGRSFEAVLSAAAGSSHDQLGVSFAGSSSFENSADVGTAPELRGPKRRTRTRFVETVYWHPNVRTDARGKATIKIKVGDSITSYRATARGFDHRGSAGVGSATFAAVKPLTIETHVATHASRGDVFDHQIVVTNRTARTLKAAIEIKSRGLAIAGSRRRHLELSPNQRRVVSVKTTARTLGRGVLDVAVSAGPYRDRAVRSIVIEGTGIPAERSIGGIAGERRTFDLDLAGAVADSVTARLSALPSIVSQMSEGSEGILREPSGCFEQTSSANYPNLLAVTLLRASGAKGRRLASKAMPMIERGYRRLRKFEAKGGGFEWFGGARADEGLTAFGLLQFHDTKAVYDGVSVELLKRTARWLLSQRDGDGGFKYNAGRDAGRVRAKTTRDAYITWALAETGHARSIKREINAIAKIGARTSDPYVLALAVLAATVADDARATGLAQRLAALQTKDGAFPGAVTSITGSGGESLLVESTALAAYALLRRDAAADASARALRWLHGKRRGRHWASTQATVLALKAIGASGESSASGELAVTVNGGPTRRIEWKRGETSAQVIEAFGQDLRSGHNRIEIVSTSRVPFSFAASYRTATAPDNLVAPLQVQTSLARSTLGLGESTTLLAEIRNTTGAVQASPLVRIGVPSGMKTEPRQLEKLQESGLVAFIETRPREVTLYFRALKPHETKRVPIALTAQAAGTLHSPPSSAAPYYTPEHVSWATHLVATVRR